MAYCIHCHLMLRIEDLTGHVVRRHKAAAKALLSYLRAR